jgi:hypothetical protein
MRGEKGTVGIGHATLNFSYMCIRQMNVVVMAGAILNDGTGRSLLHVLGQVT